MPSNDLPKGAVREIYDAIPVNGRYEQDIFNDFLLRWARYTIKDTLLWLITHGHLRKCGTTLRPLYVRRLSTGIRYTNIRPITGVETLLAMHKNLTVSENQK